MAIYDITIKRGGCQPPFYIFSDFFDSVYSLGRLPTSKKRTGPFIDGSNSVRDTDPALSASFRQPNDASFRSAMYKKRSNAFFILSVAPFIQSSGGEFQSEED